MINNVAGGMNQMQLKRLDFQVRVRQSRQKNLGYGIAKSKLYENADSSFWSVCVFLLAALSFFWFNYIGQVLISDIMVILALPVTIVWGRHVGVSWSRESKWVLGLGLIWLLSQMLTDWVRRSPFDDYAREWAKITLTLVYFIVLYIICYKNRKRLTIAALGIACGDILGYILEPNVFASGYPWKFGVALGVTILAVLLACSLAKCWRSFLWFQVGIMITIGLINLYFGYRSMGGVCLVSAILLSSRKKMFNAWMRILVIGIAIGVIYFLYMHFVNMGYFGRAEKVEYDAQASGKYGVLLGGRSAVLAAIQAITASPVIGHGSWAHNYKYVLSMNATLSALGYQKQGGNIQSALIPAHSYLLGAWVHAGIMGAIFWAYVLVCVMRALGRPITISEPLRPLVYFVAVYLIWNIFFSPYGANTRLLAVFSMVLILSCLPSESKERSSPRAFLHRYNFI